MRKDDDYPVGEGCGCKLCQQPFKVTTLTDEERALRKRARADYKRDAWELIKEQQARNGHLY